MAGDKNLVGGAKAGDKPVDITDYRLPRQALAPH
jgi:hypothetical protein